MGSFVYNMRYRRILVLILRLVTVLSVGLLWHFNRLLKSIDRKIVNVENIPERANGVSVILEGIVSLAEEAKNKGKQVYSIVENSELNRKLQEILPSKPKVVKMRNKFFLGSDRNVLVKVTDKTLVHTPVVEQKIIKVDLTWIDAIKSFFSSKVKCFERYRKGELEVNNRIFAEGVLKKTGDLSYEIEPHTIFTEKHDFTSKIKLGKRLTMAVLFVCIVIYATRVGIKYYREYMPENALRQGKKCLFCHNAANVIINDCNHMVICRACLISQNTCPRQNCERFIKSYTIIVT
jgi:hypothetical protein